MNGFQISPYLQELMTYAGQLDCYTQSNEIITQFTGLDISAMQVHRVTDTYGELLEQQTATETLAEDKMELKAGECVYAMVDGSMLLTREDGWSEVKLGRVFKESDCLQVGQERGWIKASLYEAWLGSSKTFTHRLEQKLEAYRCLGNRLVFITDGAVWMKNWINDAYPGTVQILDWYHACEHLCAFGREYFTVATDKEKWVAEQKTLLYESRTVEVIDNIMALAAPTQAIEDSKSSLVQYYQGNQNRMDYKRYRAIGAGIIGSGAIESAHRTVIQKRMKLSGQRWTKKRAQHMLAIRCTRLSGKWCNVVQLIAPQKMAA